MAVTLTSFAFEIKSAKCSAHEPVISYVKVGHGGGDLHILVFSILGGNASEDQVKSGYFFASQA